MKKGDRVIYQGKVCVIWDKKGNNLLLAPYGDYYFQGLISAKITEVELIKQ